eukprot:Hpha_TRINITY_DN16160_c1_g2::TRINITY_DN16160_c1_g2_i1::g.3216::m.3216
MVHNNTPKWLTLTLTTRSTSPSALTSRRTSVPSSKSKSCIPDSGLLPIRRSRNGLPTIRSWSRSGLPAIRSWSRKGLPTPIRRSRGGLPIHNGGGVPPPTAQSRLVRRTKSRLVRRANGWIGLPWSSRAQGSQETARFSMCSAIAGALLYPTSIANKVQK